MDNLLDELSRRDGITVSGYAQGYDRQGASHPGLAAEAAVLAHREDVDELVVCMGLDERSESEGLDRSTMQIPRAQVSMLEELKKAGKPIIIVLVSGSSVETDWLEGTQAAVYIGLSGQAGACAAANILMGDVNPSGHLAETWPLRYEDVPSAGISLLPSAIQCTVKAPSSATGIIQLPVSCAVPLWVWPELFRFLNTVRYGRMMTAYL